MKKITKIFKIIFPTAIFIALSLSIASYFIIPITTFAQATTLTEAQRCDKFASYFGIGKNDNLVTGLPKFCSLTEALTFVMNKLLIFSGTIAVIFIVVGGFFYITAAGSEEQLEKGKKMLINSVIGLVVIIMAAAIVRIVANVLTSATPGNGNQTTTTTTSGNGGNGGNAGGGQNGGTGGTSGGAGGGQGTGGSNSQNPGGLSDADIAAIASQMQVDMTSSSLIVSATFSTRAGSSSNLTEQLNKLCAPKTFPDQAALEIEVDGDPVGNAANFRSSGSSISASLTITKSQLTAGSKQISIYICGEYIRSKDVLVPQ